MLLTSFHKPAPPRVCFPVAAPLILSYRLLNRETTWATTVSLHFFSIVLATGDSGEGGAEQEFNIDCRRGEVHQSTRCLRQTPRGAHHRPQEGGLFCTSRLVAPLQLVWRRAWKGHLHRITDFTFSWKGALRHTHLLHTEDGKRSGISIESSWSLPTRSVRFITNSTDSRSSRDRASLRKQTAIS